VLQVNLGRLAEIARRAEHNLSTAKRTLPVIRELTRDEEDRCWNAAADDPEVRLFESLRVTPMVFGGIWPTLKALGRLRAAVAASSRQ
jgi:hypothetical protein